MRSMVPPFPKRGKGWGTQNQVMTAKQQVLRLGRALFSASSLRMTRVFSCAGQTQALFGIVQGGMYPDLRRESAQRTVEIDLPGYAIGGLSVGEPRPMTYEMVDAAMPYLPENKPRYLMGVGTPEEIVHYVAQGVDMMDCVLPTRAARHGLLFTSEGKISIKTARYAEGRGPARPEVRLQGVRALFAGVSAAPVRL